VAADLPVKQKHNYRTCRDVDCQRQACVAYKEGFDDGFEAGRDDAAGDG
jgi:hypothetical protein